MSSVQSLSHVQLFLTPWAAAHQASLSITNSQSLLKLMSIESAMLSNHLILFYPTRLLPSIFPSIRVFPNKSVLPRGGPSGKESACQCRRDEFNPWVGKIPWSRKLRSTPVFLPGNSLTEPDELQPMGPQRVGHD